MSPPPPADGVTAVGRRPTLAERLPRPRPRPLLVRVYASLLSDFGVLGRPSRRRLVRFLLRSLVPTVAVLGAALVALGAFGSPRPGAIQAGALAALAVAMAAAVYRRTLGAAEGHAAALREQLELGSLFVIAAYATAQSVGTADGESPLQPLVYLVMAFLVAFLSRAAGFALVGLALVLETLVWAGRGAHGHELAGAVVHGGFVALFAVLYHAVLAAHVAAGRHTERQAVARRLADIVEKARSLRVEAQVGGGAAEDEWTAAAVIEVEAAVSGALEVAEASLRAQGCAVWLLTEDEAELRLAECRAGADLVSPSPIPAGEGALGAALKTRRPVRLHGDVKPPPYRADGGSPGALLVVPLVTARGAHVRGVVLAERAAPEPFTDLDERVLVILAAEILRAVDAERYVASMRRARDEKQRFFEALARLNRVSKPAEVFDATFEAVRSVAPVDVAAITLVERRGTKVFHRIERASGEEKVSRALQGREWPDEAGGLVASAVRMGSILPGKDLDLSRTPVFDPETRLKGVTSLKLLPLRTAGEVIGVLVVGTRRPDAYGLDLTNQLDVIAMQAAVSIERARLFDKTERLATTDGLTGLLNHRTFQARLDELLAQAQRYGRRAALVLCDIDHFKSVNDTYGHPVGDVVLRAVAQTLAREARNTDLVARYGGEEFAVLMPETDAAGALVIAERIREKVAAQVVETGQGPLQVTLSLGVASYPDDADRRGSLLERADACLYQAKRAGRDRTVAAGPAGGKARASA